ncbi:protein RTF2 homolog [Zootermopsis nevadensis]|uniref:protein RTF2 homolog n=1 Tax=Zootermopsis nevadensis TaxID=136037 RepID=UPI000B8E3656|nr:protein RTF2 homolog [Zootermopsis nevadensis]
MGCDGGTIPKRAELVNTKKKPVKEKDEKNAWLWRTCSLTQLVFEPPVVSCFLGKFYNKCAVIDALLNKSPVLPQHIKRLKDIKDLKLTPNPAFKPSAEKGDEYIDCHLAPYICPVVGIEMNGKFRFVFLWGCGCVMSERALKEVKSKLCLKVRNY